MKLIIILVTIIIVLAVNAFALDTNGFRTIGMVRDLDYVHPKEGQSQCLANSPECGVCEGKVINSQCYVRRNQFTDEQLYYKNLAR